MLQSSLKIEILFTWYVFFLTKWSVGSCSLNEMFIMIIVLIQLIFIIIRADSSDTISTNESIFTSTPDEEVELTWIGIGDREDGDEMVLWDKRMFNSSRDLTSCFTFKYDNFRFTFANLTTTNVTFLRSYQDCLFSLIFFRILIKLFTTTMQVPQALTFCSVTLNLRLLKLLSMEFTERTQLN